ncbi:MAG: RIO1 family regulatory kinase/ATPase, partial [Candidatus Micrarchaeota archaeon]|nr:RIO1 family regulatory kinase/ATPase [Candidatus Micrarchaeota archaeon]
MALRLSKRKRPREEDKQVKERNLIAHRVFDDKTVEVLLHFLNKGVISSLDYPISSGKESIVFRATAPDGFLAVKIFKYETSAFRKFREYIDGDPRFSPKHSLRGYVDLWAKKEFA